MNKKTFYGFLISGGTLWAIASIVLIIGSFKDVIDTSYYQIEICKITNGMIAIQNNNNRAIVYNLNIELEFKNISSWLIVYSSNSNTTILNYFNSNFPIGTSKACYVSMSYLIIILELQHQYYTVLISGIVFLLSLIIIITLMILRCVEEYRHRGYKDIDVLKQDELESPLKLEDLTDEQDPFILVLKSTDEATRVLWKNKKQINKEEFKRLRLLQVEALSRRTEETMSVFREEVYKVLSGILRE